MAAHPRVRTHSRSMSGNASEIIHDDEEEFQFLTVQQFVKASSGTVPIEKILVANNGIAVRFAAIASVHCHLLGSFCTLCRNSSSAINETASLI
jgi:hypothetical protein